MGRANGNASTWKMSAFCIFEFFPQFLLRSTEFELLLRKTPSPSSGLPSLCPFSGEDEAFSLRWAGDGGLIFLAARQTESAAPSEADAFH